jgi:hypothetical protein
LATVQPKYYKPFAAGFNLSAAGIAAASAALDDKLFYNKSIEYNQLSRKSLGTPDEMTIFTQTLKAFRQKGWIQTEINNKM